MKKTIISLSFVFLALPALVFADGEWYTDDYSYDSGSFYTDDYSYNDNSWYTDDYSYNNSYYTDDYSYNDNSWYTDDYSYNNNWYTDDYSYKNNSWYTDDYSYNDNSWYTDDYSYNNSWYTDDYSYSKNNKYSKPNYSYPQQDYAYSQDYYGAYQDSYFYDSGYYSDYGNNNYNNGCNNGCVSKPPKCRNNCHTPNPPKPIKNLEVICSVSDRSLTKGDSTTFTANANGGKGSYTYAWLGDVTGSGRSITRIFNNEGTYYAKVRVTDANGNTSSANCDSVKVEKRQINIDALKVSCVASDRNLIEGDSTTFTANANGGRGSYTYSWSGDVSGSSRSITEQFNSEGTYQAFVRVTDQNGRTATADCDVEVEEEDEDEDDFDAICRVSDTSIEEGDTVRFTAEVDGGNSPFDYDWSGDIDDENDQSFTVRFNSEGEYDIDLEVTDDEGRIARDTCTVRVEEEDEDDDEDDDDDDRDINVTTDRSDFGNLASVGSVYLNQIPYTGPEDTAKGIAFAVGILAWSIGGALIIRKKMNKNSVSNRIEAFKNANKNNTV